MFGGRAGRDGYAYKTMATPPRKAAKRANAPNVTEDNVIEPGAMTPVGQVGGATLNIELAGEKIALEDQYRCWVVPVDSQVNLNGKFATQLFDQRFGNMSVFLPNLRNNILSLLPTNKASGTLLTSETIIKFNVTTLLGPRCLLFATTFGNDGKATLANVATATRAILQQELNNSPHVSIPLLGAGSGGLPPLEVAKTLVRTIRTAPIHTSIQYVTVSCPDLDAYNAAVAAAAEPLPEEPDFIDPNARPQKAYNDVPGGIDKLGVETEIKALSEMIMLREMQPPLVVGVLGGWGSGKSFVMHLMKKHLMEIRRRNLAITAAWEAQDNTNNADANKDATKKDTKADLSPFVGHIYQVHFDAWTYAKADLWASLMQTIFLQLDDQLRVENALRGAKDKDNKYKYSLRDNGEKWYELTTSSREKRRVLLEDAGMGKEALDADSPLGLWETYKKLKFEKIKKLENTKDMLKSANAQADLADAEVARKAREIEDIKNRGEREVEEIKSDHARQIREINDKRDQEINKLRDTAEGAVEAELKNRYEAAAILKIKELARDLGESAAKKIEEKLNIQKGHPFADPKGTMAELSDLSAKAKWLLQKRPLVPILLLLMSAAAFGFSFIAPWLANEWKNLQIPAIVGTIVTLIGGAWDAMHKHKAALEQSYRSMEKTINDIRDQVDKEKPSLVNQKLRELVKSGEAEGRIPLEAVIDPAMEAAVQEKIQKNKKLEEKKVEEKRAEEKKAEEKKAVVEQLARDVDKLQQELGKAALFTSINDFVNSRMQAKDYNERLGLLQQVQNDIKDLSDCLATDDDGPAANERRVIFERGPARVVLFIDDLDRCPPESVVKVLEAAQLLVKTPLFVVVIAMDLRYVTRSLEKHYQEILVRNGEPSGLDYLEKIIQIPYRVRPVRSAALNGYLKNQMAVKPDKKSGQAGAGAENLQNANVNNNAGGGAANPPNNINNANIADKAENNNKPASEVDPKILETEIQFKEWEFKYFEKCCGAVEVTPRAIKRLVNVFKLMKIVWFRSGAIGQDAEKIVIWLLVMSAAFPVELNILLDEILEILPTKGTVDDDADPDERIDSHLSDLLSNTAEKYKDAPGATRWARLIAVSKRTLHEGAILNKVGESTVDLLRSLSFLGMTDRLLPHAAEPHADEPRMPPEMQQSA